MGDLLVTMTLELLNLEKIRKIVPSFSRSIITTNIVESNFNSIEIEKNSKFMQKHKELCN